RKTAASYSFTAKSPENTTNVSRILLPRKPLKVTVNGSNSDFSWDDASKTCLLKFENSPDGVEVTVHFDAGN
ncbi:MAG: hypothetical protein LBR06_07270, partial [Bacteroidales bacterium]|nr:hypothetical protein [Bacteroidales bacterium]